MTANLPHRRLWCAVPLLALALLAAGCGGGDRYSSNQTGGVTPPPGPVGAPVNLTVRSTSATSIELSWTAPADDGGGAIEAYNVYRCTEDQASCTLEPDDWIAWVADGAAFTDTHDDSSAAEAGGTSRVLKGSTYRYAVAAYRSGEGAWSNEVTATAWVSAGADNTAPQFPAGASIGDLVFTLWTPVDSVVLPRAAGGNIDANLNAGEASDYSFDPAALPAGLDFDPYTRLLSGTPSETRETARYTLRVHDDDADHSPGDADSLDFTITVNGSEAVIGGTFIEAYQYLEQADWSLDREPDGMNWSAVAWRGERVHAPLMVWADETDRPDGFVFEMSDLTGDSGEIIPREQVKVLFPTYVEADPTIRTCNGYASREDYPPVYLADALSPAAGPVDLPNDPYKVWLTVEVPENACPANYRGTFRAGDPSNPSRNASFTIDLRVLPLDIQTPSDWQFALNLWQHPERVLALYNDAHPGEHIERWSPEHYRLLESSYRLLASTGQKSITTTIKDGALGAPGMVSWSRASESGDDWRFDWSVFGAHVETLMGWGIERRIDAFGIIGWNRDEIPYWSIEQQAMRVLHAPPGSAAHADVWQRFLPAFRAYLNDRGWFDRTYLAVDEAPDDLEAVIELIRGDHAGWKIALSYVDAYLPEHLRRQVDALDVHLGGAAIAGPAVRAGQIRTFYTSCYYDSAAPITRVNSLITPDSNPADVEWLTWYADKLGMAGYSRWAYDYWRTADPLDMRSGLAHTSGDSSLIYRTSNDIDLEAMTSVRLEMLRQGVQAFEKRRLLRELYTRHDYAAGLEVLDALLRDEFISTSSGADGRARDDLIRARQQLDTVSIEASSLVTPDSRCN